MIQLTEKAAKAINRFIKFSEEPIIGLRVGVDGGGCSGFRYQIEPAKSKLDNDIVVECSSGIKVYIDPVSAPMVNGMSIDWLETLTESKFVFENPNATGSCGCGDSFTVN